MNSVVQQVVMVIGGSSGIGFEVARRVAAEGAEVIVVGRDERRLAEATARLGHNARAVAGDAHHDERIGAIFSEAPMLDHVVSMVGDSMAGGFLATTPATMRHVIDSKFWANWTIARHAADHIRPGGSITFTSGTGGRPHEVSATYVANLGIDALVRGLAHELAPNVRVNAVAPTFMGAATSFWRDLPPADVRAAAETFAQDVPLGRLATVEEVASTYLYLIANGFVTGQVVAVDGGVMLRK